MGNSQPECSLNDSFLPTNCVNISNSGEYIVNTICKIRALINHGLGDTFVIAVSPDILFNSKHYGDKRLLQNFRKSFYNLNKNEILYSLDQNPLKTMKGFFSMDPFTIFRSSVYIDGRYRNLVGRREYEKRQLKFDNNLNRVEDDNVVDLFGIQDLHELLENNPNIVFVLVRLPTNHGYSFDYQVESIFDSKIKLIEKLDNARYVNYCDLVLEDSFFYDDLHLNYLGARNFTTLFFNDVFNCN